MPHYKTMYDDKEFLFAFDLKGKEATVQIEKVFAGTVEGEKGRKSKKPVIKFRGSEKKLAVNKTNGKTIAKLYGTDTDAWIGQALTLYPTTTEFGGETVECIRIKPQVPRQQPNARGNGNGKSAQPPQQAAPEPDSGELTEEERAQIARDEAASREP